MSDSLDTAQALDLVVAALGGTARAGQIEMAKAVGAAITDGEHLLVQAGTGTGKSIGYLVPAVLHAVTSGERVVISTATLALQRQLLTQDLPLVVDALADLLPRPVTFAVLKGWANYLCRARVGGGYPEEEGALFAMPGGKRGEERLVDQVRRVVAWAGNTTTGDRDDLQPGVSDRAWRQASVSTFECLGQRCPQIGECFPEAARDQARNADMVVTNHAMLGIAAGGNPGVLPEHDVVVVDEAHELVDRVTSAATCELSAPIVERAARTARRHGGSDTETGRLELAGGGLERVLAAVPEGLLPSGLSTELATGLAAVRDAARSLLSVLKPDDSADLGEAAGVKLAQAAVLQVFETAERMAAGNTERDVFWITGSDAGRRIYSAPLSVAGLIDAGLLAEATGVFTSATLRLGGSFALAAHSFGLRAGAGAEAGAEAGDGWRGIDVGSPFDYASQGILYVATNLPAPGREAVSSEQLDEITDLISAADGRALVLFTSRKAVEEAVDAVRERLEVPILAQYEDQVPALVAEFLATPRACLFGTRTLWQGVDLPGDTCHLVVIARLPFPRPDDPISSARARAIERAGGNGFMQVSIAHAALLLAQGAGRLIRTVTDRGVVAVLDPRLVTARYGDFLVQSLPPFWRTTDKETVLGALQRLSAAARGAEHSSGS